MQNGCFKYNLPGWGESDVFECVLKTPSILDLASKGKIPNPLIGPVVALFKGELKEDMNSLEGLKNVNELAEFFCDVCLVEPTYSELKEAGGLTDKQKIHIYMFATRGVKALYPFLKSSEFPLFLNLVQTYDLRPSEVMGIEDTYVAYCFDQALLEYVFRIRKGEKPLNDKPKKEKNT